MVGKAGIGENGSLDSEPTNRSGWGGVGMGIAGWDVDGVGGVEDMERWQKGYGDCGDVSHGGS